MATAKSIVGLSKWSGRRRKIVVCPGFHWSTPDEESCWTGLLHVSHSCNLSDTPITVRATWFLLPPRHLLIAVASNLNDLCRVDNKLPHTMGIKQWWLIALLTQYFAPASSSLLVMSKLQWKLKYQNKYLILSLIPTSFMFYDIRNINCHSQKIPFSVY